MIEISTEQRRSKELSRKLFYRRYIFHASEIIKTLSDEFFINSPMFVQLRQEERV